MTGRAAGVIGVKREQVLERFITQLPVRFETADEDPWVMACLVTTDGDGRAAAIEQILVPGRSAP